MPYESTAIPRLLGLNLDENPESLATGELTKARNAARRGTMVGTRPGVAAPGSGSDYENAITGGNPIRGAIEFRESYDEGRHLITISDHATTQIWYEDANALPSGPNLNADQDYIWSLAIHNNLLWGTGGPPGKGQAQTELTWTWDGVVGNAPTTITLTNKDGGATLYPKFIKAWRNFVLANGFQQTTANIRPANNPSVARFATFGTDPALDVNWKDGNTIGFQVNRIGLDTYGENYATGFGEFTDNAGDSLIMLSNRQLQAVTFDVTGGNVFRAGDPIANGCVHERAYINLGLDVGEAIFVSDIPAVHSLRQSQEFGQREETFLSWKIRTIMNSLNKTRIHFTCGVYAANLGCVILAFSSATNTSAGHDFMMCLDVKDQESLTSKSARWYGPWILGGGLKVNHMAYIRDAANVYAAHIFTTNGRVLRFDETVHSDLVTNEYSVLVETGPESYGSILSEKRLGDTAVTIGTDVGGGHTITCRPIFDFGRKTSPPSRLATPTATGSVVGNAAIVGTATVGGNFSIVNRKLFTGGKFEVMGMEFSHGGLNEPFYIGRIDHQIAGAGEGGESSD